MANTIKKAAYFPAELTKEMFSKVKGHSSLAKLKAEEPVAFNGTDIFVFDFDGEVSIVGESAAKPAGGASIEPVQMRPIKVVYQSRVSDEFVNAAEEVRLEYLRKFSEGFSKKIGAGFDVMAMHGVNPATGESSSLIGNNHFDYVTNSNTVTLSDAIDKDIEDAIGLVEDTENIVTGIIFAPAARTAMGALRTGTGERTYPDFAFGAVPDKMGAGTVDVNATVSKNGSKDRVLVGDFANAFKWGYAKEIPLEVIEYGDPDGAGRDLKQYNEVLLRSEVFIGWGILDGDAFAKVASST